MKNRAIVWVGVLCLLLTGCVQSEQVYTLNPDGSGKVDITLVTPVSPFGVMAHGPTGAKKSSLEEKKRDFLSGMLGESQGADAWKDVSAEFTPDGRLKFGGTAYFKDFSKFKEKTFAAGVFKLVRGADGSLRLTIAAQTQPLLGGAKDKEGSPDPKKATDKELDEYILQQRVEYQNVKGMQTAMLTDARLKYVFRLPGDVSEVNVYRGEGKRAVSIEFEGDRILKAMNTLFARDNAFFRKQLRAGGSMSLKGIEKEFFKGLGLDWHEANVTVAKPAGPQFDYAKEMGAAREAYPALRKRLGLGEETKIPELKDLKDSSRQVQ
jgi:hypothetical protein